MYFRPPIGQFLFCVTVVCFMLRACIGHPALVERVVYLFSDLNMWTWMSHTTVPSLNFFICKVMMAV